MKNRIIYNCIFILFGVSTSINAQRLYELTPYSFYQEWALDSEEPDDNLLVFKPRERFQTITSNYSYSVLNFNKQHYLLYFFSPKAPKKSKPVKVVRPINWSNAPKKVLRPKRRCGFEPRVKRNKIETYKAVNLKWKKGNWRVFGKDGNRFLVLEHKVSKNGKKYKVVKKEEFQIVSLDEDKMVLRKVKLHEENL